MNKPEQLRLAADIIEKNLPWEKRHPDCGGSWFSGRTLQPHGSIFNGYEIRIAPPPPEPVPLTAEDVPPGSAIRFPSHNPIWMAVTNVGTAAVAYGNCDSITTYRDLLLSKAEIKRPGEDWKPCSKPA